MKKLILIFIALTSYHFVEAQCTVDITPTSATSSCGDTVFVTANGVDQPPVLSNDFNNGTLGPGWSSSVNSNFSNPCGPSLDGTPSAWFGGTTYPRTLTTNSFDVSCGATICFDLDFAGDENSTNCEDPDEWDEGVHLQYSTNGGASWTDIFYFDPTAFSIPNGYYSWDNYCFVIPAAAETANTMFRWNQPEATSSGYDHWGIDNVEIQANDCGYYYDWIVDGTTDNQDTFFIPTTQTTYEVLYTNGIDDSCYADITIDVLNPDIDPYQDQVVCDNYTLPSINGTDLNGNESYYDGPGATGTQYSPGDVISSTTTIYAYAGVAGCNDEESFDITVANTLVDFDTSNYVLESCPNSDDGSLDVLITVNQTSGSTVNIDDIEWVSPTGTITNDPGGNGQATYTTSMSNMEDGTWTINLLLDNGCDVSETFDIETEDPIIINVDNVVELDCAFEDSAQINVTTTGGSAPYSFQWDDPDNTTTEDIEEITFGTYTLTVTDDRGCSEDVSVTIDNPTPLDGNVDVSCDGTVAGNGLVFTFTGGLPEDQGFGNYTVINNGDGVLSATSVNNGGSVFVTDLGDQENGDLTIVDGNGCSYDISATFFTPQFNTAIVNASDCGGASAADGSVEVTVVPGSGQGAPYDITMNGNNYTNTTNETESSLFAGTNVNIVVTDQDNCASDSSVTVGSDGAGINMVEDLNVDASCFGSKDGQLHVQADVFPVSVPWEIQNITINTPAGYTDTDPSGTGQQSHLIEIDTAYAGTWTITIELDNGCVFTNSFIIDQPTQIQSSVITSEIACHNGNDGSIDLTTIGGTPSYSFNWSGPDGFSEVTEDVDQLTYGEYMVTITDDNGCTQQVPVEIDNPDQFSAEVVTERPTCHGYEDGFAEVTNITGNNGGVSFVWSTDNPNGNTNPVDNLVAGTYTVQLFDQNGCDTIIEFVIDETPDFVVNNVDTEPSKCRSNGIYPGTGQVTANIGGSNGGVSIVWEGNGEVANTPTWANRPPGTYTYTATDIKGCEYTGTVEVDSINPEASFTATPTQGNAPLVVDVENTSTGIDQNNASYSWDSGFGIFNSTEVYSYAPDTTYTQGGDYVITLVVTNEYGCKDTAIQEITVFTPLDYTPPNIFSPNGDGANDVFYIPGQGIAIENFSMVIVNRWGETLFETSTPGVAGGWNGTNKKGKDMPEGVYFYTFEIQAEDGTQVEGQDMIHLMRSTQ